MEAAGHRALNLRHSPMPLRSPLQAPLRSTVLLRPSLLREIRTGGDLFSPLRRTPHRPPSLSYHSADFPEPLFSPAENGSANSSTKSNVESRRETCSNKLLQVVLVSPQIAGNTGCIARTCAASAVGLHLVGPLGYTIEDSKLKRAGLDYWPYPAVKRCKFSIKQTFKRYVVVKVHNSWSEFRDYFSQQDGEKRLLAFTKRGTNIHSDFSYRQGDWLVFGSETSGLPPEALMDCSTEGLGGGTIRIPMVETYVRCLNLSVSVGIALYEASRQLNYEQLQYSSTVDANQRLFMTEDIFG